jgi:hypothetical protein
MPWLTLWVDPVPFTTHRGVTIYHTYNDMDARSGFERFRFTTSKNDGDPCCCFDVRDLTAAGASVLRNLDCDTTALEQAAIREIIHAAIEKSILKADQPPSLVSVN